MSEAKIAILNCSNPLTVHLESDEYVSYKSEDGGRKSCFIGSERIKQCSSWNSWGYALETEFFVYGKEKWNGCFAYGAIIVLVNRNMEAVLPLIKKMKLMKKKVAVAFHEGGADLVGSSGIPGEVLGSRWIGLTDLVKEADMYLNLFGQIAPFFEGWFGKEKVKQVHHATPLDWQHSLTIPFHDRPYDILCGTRTFNQRLPRNTIVALGALNGLARDEGYNVHLLSEDGNVEPLLRRCGLSNIQVHQGPLTWSNWIKFLAQFQAIVHFDHSLNLGQIVYDAILVDVAPIGSTCYNNMLCGTDDSGDLRMWSGMIKDNLENHEYWRQCEQPFRELVHPDAVKKQLMELFE